MQATKPDGKIIFGDCTVVNNVIKYTASEQFATVAGNVICEIGLYEPDPLGDTNKDKLLQSATFEVQVKKSAMDRNAIESTNDFQTLTTMINEVKQSTNNANDAALNATNISNQLANETLIIWKPYVDTYSSIVTTYPSPSLGWTTQANDTGVRWRYNGTEWTNIGTFENERVGDLSNLPTDDKSNLVNAIIEVDNEKLDKRGDSKNNTVSFVEATVEEDIVSGESHFTIFSKLLKSIKTFRTAINNLVSAVGALANLPTTDKASLVNAIIELNNNKISTNKITQSATTNQTDYIPSSAVIYRLQQSVNSNTDNVSTLISNLPYVSKNVVYNDAVADPTYRRIDLNVNAYDGKINGYFRTLSSGLGVLLCTLPSDSRPKNSTYCTVASATSSGFATIQTDGKVLVDISATGAIYVITGTFVK
jgi:hypothetical protein